MTIPERKLFQAKGRAGAKALKRRHAWCVCRTVRKPEWLDRIREGKNKSYDKFQMMTLAVI